MGAKDEGKNRLGLLLFGLAILLGIFPGFGGYVYSVGRLTGAPLHPVPEQGYVVPFNNHGVIHYVHMIDYRIYEIALTSFVLAVILGAVSLRIGRK